ncbi:MAG: hypothetical protein PGN23_13450 [Sphingomonas adhaesiva]|uniref:hypothetical protein n=1 Tax=Sphingomonas adhaesiva TaxID=28212 RepID=UPI002FF4D7D2
MIAVTNNEGPIVQAEKVATEENKRVWSKGFHVALDVFSIIFWSYAIIKVFIFDIDTAIVSYLPPVFSLALKYKILIILLSLSATMLITKSLSLLAAVAYVSLFPLILIFWKGPKTIWRKGGWLLVFASLNAIFSTFSSFKSKFISVTVAVLSIVAIIVSSNVLVLRVFSILLFIILVHSYTIACVKAFKPSAIFKAYKSAFPAVRNSEFLKMDEKITLIPVPQMSEGEIKLRNSAMQNVVIYNRICLFLAKRLRDYQRSGLNKLANIGGVVRLLMLTIIVFSIINFAAYKVDAYSFQFSYSRPTFFSFIYYATGSMFYASNGMAPTAVVSQAIQIAQFGFSVGLLVIFITIVLATRDEKYGAEVAEVIRSAEQESEAMDRLVRSSFNMNSIDAAIEALQSAKSELIGMIIAITKSIDSNEDFKSRD